MRGFPCKCKCSIRNNKPIEMVGATLVELRPNLSTLLTTKEVSHAAHR